jgi:hypothetical protein
MFALNAPVSRAAPVRLRSIDKSLTGSCRGKACPAVPGTKRKSVDADRFSSVPGEEALRHRLSIFLFL